MRLAFEEMLKSTPDLDTSKNSPLVGAVVVWPNGEIDTAHRCHTRDGHHCEETLLDDFHPDKAFDGAELYVTLEPCVAEARSPDKTSCAERIVNARIRQVYIGMLDPNPRVYRKGQDFLLDNGVIVGRFDAPITAQIEKANEQFIRQFGVKPTEDYRKLDSSILPLLSEQAVAYYCSHAAINTGNGLGPFWDRMLERHVIERRDKGFGLTTIGAICFAKDTRTYCDPAVVQLVVTLTPQTILNPTGGPIEIRNPYPGPMVLIAEVLEEWADKYIIKRQDRDGKNTETRYIIPFLVMKEALINAVAHRDYDGVGAYTQFRILDDRISVENPSRLERVSLKNLQNFTAKSNPVNPELVSIFQDIGLMERQNAGMETFSNESPRPIFSHDGQILTLDISYSDISRLEFLERKANVELNDMDIALFEYVRQHHLVTRAEIQRAFNLKERTANNRLKKLVDIGALTIVRKGSSRSVFYRVT